MVVYQKWFEDEIARWKVRRPRYDLSKQLKKIHMQQRGKMGSGATPEEAVPEGRRDVTRRAPTARICPYCGSEQVAKALPRQSLVRENGGYRRSGRAASTPMNGETMHVLPFHRQTGCGRITDNAERERPLPPCVRWCDERQTHFSIFPTAIVLYSRHGTRPSFE